MGLLTRKDILGTTLAVDDVDVPEWGGVVRVRELTGNERDRFEFQMLAAQREGKQADTDVRASIVARAIVDEDGKREFADADIAKLGQKSARALDRVFDAVRDLSGMQEDAVDEDVEDFGDAQHDGSDTD